MSTIVGTLQEIIRHELRSLRITELGIVEAVAPHSAATDNGNYGVDVRLKNSGLLLKRVPVATGHIGTAAIPNVGDLVVVAFDKGDVNQPVVIGRLYNDKDRPPLNDVDQVIFRLPLAEPDDKTIKGSMKNPRGGATAREILFELPPKITVRITDGNVRATAGHTEMILDQPDGGGGAVTVMSGGSKIVMNQDGDVTVEAAQALNLTAGSDFELIAGGSVKISAGNKVDIEAGSSATLSGGAQAKLLAGGPATIQGGLVSIQGTTSFSP